MQVATEQSFYSEEVPIALAAEQELTHSLDAPG